MLFGYLVSFLGGCYLFANSIENFNSIEISLFFSQAMFIFLWSSTASLFCLCRKCLLPVFWYLLTRFILPFFAKCLFFKMEVWLIYNIIWVSNIEHESIFLHLILHLNYHKIVSIFSLVYVKFLYLIYTWWFIPFNFLLLFTPSPNPFFYW